MLPFKSIKNRLVLIMLVCSFVPLLLLLFMAFPKAQKDLEKALIRNLEGVKQKQLEIVKLWFHERKQDARVVGKNTSVLLERGLVDNDFSKLQDYTEMLRTEYGYKAVCVTSRDGLVLAATEESLTGSNIMDQPYCREALNGNLFLSKIQPSIQGEKTQVVNGADSSTMFISVPLNDSAKSVIGMVGFKISTKPLSEIMKNANLGKTGEAFLLDREGFMLTESRFADEVNEDILLYQGTGVGLRVVNPQRGRFARYGNWMRRRLLNVINSYAGGVLFIRSFVSFFGSQEAEPRSMKLTAGAQKCLSGESGYDAEGYINYDGRKVLGAWCWIPEYDCGLLAQTSIREGYGAAYSLKKFVHSMLLILAFPLAMAAFYFGKRISDPILNITEVTKKITSGDLGQRVIESGKNDEINELAKAFNIMAESLEEKTIELRDYTTDLENVVRERTLELQSTTNFLNSILAGSTEYSIIAEDLEGNILAFNKGASLIYGYKAEEMIDVANVRVLHVDDDVKSGMVDNILKVARETGRYEAEVMRKRKNGEVFLAHITVTLRRDEKGKPIGFVVISKDITKEKLEALQKEIVNNVNKIVASGLEIHEVYKNVYHELKRIIDFAWFGVVYLMDGTEIVEYTNIIDGVLLHVDLPEGNKHPFRSMAQNIMIQKSIPVTVSDTLREQSQIDRELYEKDIRSYVCFPLVSKGITIGTVTLGSRKRNVFTKLHSSLLNQVLPQLAIAIENTRLFLSIRASEEKYRDLVENAPEMIHEISPEGKFINVNKTELNKLGYSIEEMRKMMLYSIVPGEYRDDIKRHIKQIKEYRSSELETVFSTKSGKEIHVEINGTSLCSNKTGECLRIREFVRDITERKKMEGQVRRSEKLASMGELAAAIAHEIRNPLGAICNSIGILDSRLNLTDQEKNLIEMIVGQSERLDRIISDFLGFAHPREPSFSLQDIRSVIKNTIFLLRQDSRCTDKIKIKEVYESILPNVYIDADLIHQILWNLLVNSLDAMPNGGQIKITVRKTTLFLRKAVEIVIRDTGTGMNPHELNKIFEPFYTKKSEGTGLGLSIVQRIIDDHGGAVDVKSKECQGTTFYVKLPAENEKWAIQN
ncbi:MAG: PAS domain S-box protein [Candidatus Brocadiaceae bacterium]|nr:PAS domain S-box protein [Candidatus Brocadiaceae bacterium]